MSKGLEALHRIANAKNHFKYDTLELVDKDFQIVQQELQRLEAIDNIKPNEVMKKLEMLSDCAEAMKEAPSSNWIEYASSETELDYKLWRAYEDLKQYIIKSQEQEKVLKIVFEKSVDIDCIKQSNNVDEYNSNSESFIALTEEDFDLLKRYCNG